MLSTVVDEVELACESIYMKRKNAKMSNRQTNMDSNLVETRSAGRTMRTQIPAAENQIKNFKKQVANAQLAVEKLADELPKTEANF